MLAGAVRAADPNDPADPKLKAAYHRPHFSEQYPPEAVQLIQSRLQDLAQPLPGIAELAKDQRPEVRSLVALLLGEYGDADGAKILWLLTRDEFESVRLTAAGAIVRLAHLTPVTSNVAGLQDERPAVRRLTASILAALGDKKTEDDLIKALKDNDELVRTDVVRALGKEACGTERSLPALVAALHDPSVEVRDHAARVLGGFQDAVVVEPLIKTLKDPDWHVRASAADSLGVG